MNKENEVQQKIIELKLKKRELVLAGKSTIEIDEEIKEMEQKL